jgi:hypothetical protein
METGTRGALFREFPATISLKNWPFLVLMVFLAALAGYAGQLTGNRQTGLILAVAVVFPAVVVLGVQVLGGFFVRRVTAAYEGGFVVRRYGSEELVSWQRVKSVGLRRETLVVRGVPLPTAFFAIDLAYDDRQLTVRPPTDATEVATFMAQRAGVALQGG